MFRAFSKGRIMAIEWTKYSSPVYVSASEQSIDCILTVTGMGDIPFTASATDSEQHGRDIFAAIVANAATTPIAPFSAPSASASTPPTIQKQAAALLGKGLTISSMSMRPLNGTYPVDSATQNHMQSEIISIMLSGSFADGSPLVSWPDTSGNNHAFSVAQFKAFALAVGAYVAGLYKVINGSSTTIPASTASIP